MIKPSIFKALLILVIIPLAIAKAEGLPPLDESNASEGNTSNNGEQQVPPVSEEANRTVVASQNGEVEQRSRFFMRVSLGAFYATSSYAGFGGVGSIEFARTMHYSESGNFSMGAFVTDGYRNLTEYTSLASVVGLSLGFSHIDGTPFYIGIRGGLYIQSFLASGSLVATGFGMGVIPSAGMEFPLSKRVTLGIEADYAYTTSGLASGNYFISFKKASVFG